MATFKTEGLVLAKKTLKGADRIYTLYTPDHGKLEAKVRSAALSRSKLAGHLEPFSLASVMVARGKEMETIAGAQALKYYSFKELPQYTLACLVSELVIKELRPEEKDERIYNLMKAFMEALSQEEDGKSNGSGRLELMALRFLWKLLTFLGYRPDLSQAQGQNFTKLSKEGLELLDYCLSERGKLTILHASSKVIRELADFTVQYLKYFFEKDFKSLNLFFYGKQKFFSQVQ